MNSDINVRLAAYKARSMAGEVLSREQDEDVNFAKLMSVPYEKGAVEAAIGPEYIDTNNGSIEAGRDLWEEVGMPYASYTSETHAMMIAVLEGIGRRDEGGYGLHGSEIADCTGIPECMVTMLQYVLCGAGLADYGSNPMGCWYQGEEPFADYLAAWREEYMRNWLRLPPNFYKAKWVEPKRPVLVSIESKSFRSTRPDGWGEINGSSF